MHDCWEHIRRSTVIEREISNTTIIRISQPAPSRTINNVDGTLINLSASPQASNRRLHFVRAVHSPSHPSRPILNDAFCSERVTMHCQWGENPQNCPFPLGFRHPAGGGPSYGYRQHSQKNLVKIARVVPEISSRTDKQTQTDIIITILRHRSRGRSKKVAVELLSGKILCISKHFDDFVLMRTFVQSSSYSLSAVAHADRCYTKELVTVWRTALKP